MSNAKHTPGPWIIPKSPDFHNHPFHVQDANGYAICDMAAEYSSINEDAEHEANARLIAAAPELLEALEESLNQLVTIQLSHKERWSNEMTNMVSAARLKAENSIAKARGE